MSEVHRKIEKLREEIAALERTVLERRAFMAGLQEALKLQSRGNGTMLRPGSEIYRAMEILKRAGKPMHVDKILTALGKEATPQTKTSLTGSLGGYARKNQIFNRPAPNTFGLMEFDSPTSADFISEEDHADGVG